MVSKYIGKPVYCEAFKFEPHQDKFHRWLREKPEWFQSAYTSGGIQMTMTDKEAYIIIYDGKDARRARSGDMIVRNSYGRIFSMGPDEFNEAFSEIVCEAA